MLGIDIYERYNPVYNWELLAKSVDFVYLKGTDGGGLANVRADRYAHETLERRIPVGLYHYAQLTPSPEEQADVLTDEVRRLGADVLPPALDIEHPFVPGAAANTFTQRFLKRLRHNGFPRVTLYANVSMMSTLDTSGVDVVWIAGYGANDGNPHPLSYKGTWHVHQYTSKGNLAGVTGWVDLNRAYAQFWKEKKVSLHDDTLTFWDDFKLPAARALAECWQLLCNLSQYASRPGQTEEQKYAALPEWVRTLLADVAQLKVQPATVDYVKLVDELEARGLVTQQSLTETLNNTRLAAG